MSRISAKQQEYKNDATARINVKIGARRCGKTYFDILHTIPYQTRTRAGRKGLNVVFGVSKETIERNVLKPMREIYGSQLVGEINSKNKARLFGEDFYCLGAEKRSQVGKVQGSSIKYAYWDELAKCNRDVFEMSKGSLDKAYSRMDCALNPEDETHWLKVSFLDKIEEEHLSVYVQHYTIFDNPFLPPEFVENFCKEMKAAGEMWYRRLCLGEWCNASGLVYPNFTTERNIVENHEPTKQARFYISLDYGTFNPFAAGLWCVERDKAVQIAEYYYNGRDKGRQKTDEEYYKAIEELAGDYRVEAIIIDPSASSFIETVRRHGRFKTKKAENEVANGILNCSSFIGAGMIQICACCKETIKEFGAYSWDEKANGDVPLKKSDHAMDQMRYISSTILKRLFKWHKRGNAA